MGARKKKQSEKKRQVVLKGYKNSDIELLGGYENVKTSAESFLDRKLKQTKK